MWRKTAIRALSSILPLSPELRDAVRTDDEDAMPANTIDLGTVAFSDDIAPSKTQDTTSENVGK